ncbi:MAG: thiamine biosynthesis protein ThiS [Clostridiaceae bacterium BRH_c20a]|nr:MAG: thiamine biosynthesis protein ThiS [Clostridiaceae bacterium BRH_c20a]
MIKVNNRPIEWQEGMTIKKLINSLKYSYPVLIVTINGEHIPREKYEEAAVADGDDVKIIHPIAGG